MVAVAFPAAASAHLGHQISSAERYLKVDVAGNGARVIVSLTLGAAEGARLLADADRDGDGRVSEAERDAHLARWASGLEDELPIYENGARLAVEWTDGWLEPIGPVRAVPLSVELTAHLAVYGRSELRVEDRMVQREVYERTDVAFRARDEAELLRCGIGEEAPDGCDPDLAYADIPEDAQVRLWAIVQTPARPLSWREAAVLGAALILLGVLTLAWMRPRGAASR